MKAPVPPARLDTLRRKIVALAAALNSLKDYPDEVGPVEAYSDEDRQIKEFEAGLIKRYFAHVEEFNSIFNNHNDDLHRWFSEISQQVSRLTDHFTPKAAVPRMPRSPDIDEEALAAAIATGS